MFFEHIKNKLKRFDFIWFYFLYHFYEWLDSKPLFMGWKSIHENFLKSHNEIKFIQE
jgi:hypothetical protein